MFARLVIKVPIRATTRLACLALATIGAVGTFGAPSAASATAFLTSFSPGYPAIAVDLLAGTSFPIANPDGSAQIAIAPDGATAYVTNVNTGTVTPIDVAAGTPGTPIAVRASRSVVLPIVCPASVIALSAAASAPSPARCSAVPMSRKRHGTTRSSSPGCPWLPVASARRRPSSQHRSCARRAGIASGASMRF